MNERLGLSCQYRIHQPVLEREELTPICPGQWVCQQCTKTDIEYFLWWRSNELLGSMTVLRHGGKGILGAGIWL